MPFKKDNVISLLEDAVALQPNKIALRHETTELTYSQLNVQAAQLAHYLKQWGPFKDVSICFCLPQSVEKVVTMLAIWKVGGAYVSIDPFYPEGRLRHILEDTNSPILIITKALLEKFPFYKGIVVIIDEIKDEIASMPLAFLSHDINNRLCYFAYTSGSTGVPKAVMVEHTGLGNFINHYAKFLNGNPADVALSLSSSHFDAIVVDLWIPLVLGMTVVLYPDNRLIGQALLTYICEKHITVLPYLPISILATLPKDKPIGNLHTIGTGGEAPIANVIAHWKKKVVLLNFYGPTETTVAVCGFKFDDTHPVGTIGLPLPNVDFYILDQNLNEVAENEIGELHIGGIQVSRGYYRQPELTREKFINFQATDSLIGRVYKTGDLVRRLPDGNIEFIGRADQQVKIRGFRVEPAEIEEQIRQSGLVENAFIVVREDQGEKQLVCFYKGRNTFPEDLRAYLFDRLPAHMIPSWFMEMEDFPLTANGKIDKSILKKIDLAEEKRNRFTPAKTKLQQDLVSIWGNILNRKIIGIHDNFFQFGGNSILAYRLISSIRQTLGTPLQTSDLFLYPTIFSLEAYILSKDFSEVDASLVWNENKGVLISAQQQGLWFIDQLNGSVAYNVGVVYPVSEEISFDILAHAIQKLLQKHAVLRTVIHEKSSMPFLVEISEDNWKLESISVQENLQKLVQIPFNLQTDYLLRAYLITDCGKPNALLLVVHHLATDGWSMPLIVHEINTFYSDLLAGNDQKTPVFPEYKHYANWQSQQDKKDGIHFWSNYLEDFQVLQLAHDGKKDDSFHDVGSQLKFEIGTELTASLQKISEEQSATLYTTLLSAFALLMQYYSGQSDLCIGSPSANRPHYFDKTIGYFVNMLPIRMKIEGNPNFSEFLRQNRDMLPNILKYQDVPLETIVSHVVKDRSVGRNPVFQHAFILQNPVEHSEANQQVNNNEGTWIFNGHTKFDLQFEAFPAGDVLKFTVDYSSALFKQQTIAEMIKVFQLILASIVENPHRKIGSIPVHSVIESVLQEAVSETRPIISTLIALFENQVQATPDKIALILSEAKISYLELHDMSGLVAQQLIAAGVRRGDFIGCLQEQSVERVYTLLGIMKAGATYVPLDVTYPIERINLILNDTKAKIVLTSKQNQRPDDEITIPVVLVENLLNHGIRDIQESFFQANLPSDIAYVMHTSGTTGVPKGVLITHEALGNFITTYDKLLEIGTDDQTLQFSPYNFDGSVIDLWIPLIKGATIHLYPNNKLLGNHLAEFIAAHNISKIPFISPSVLATIDQHFDLPLLKVIGIGGEACPNQVSAHWKRRVKLINVYGPTETTVAVNEFVFDDTHPQNTIGKPIKNMKFYVLDQYFRPIPHGVIGDFYISGIQLSVGYLNQPILTDASFLENPFEKNENSIYRKIYKTGDQMRTLPDGMLQYVGRSDDQVKIRGFRIELTEIERVLHQIPGVSNAIVYVHTFDDTVKSLRAFIVGAVEIADIRKELIKKLPAYMIPNEIFRADALPVTSNGKIDKNVLQLIAEKKNDEIGSLEEKPINEYEKIIKQVWADVLQRNVQRVDDDFFLLGGHSLLLTKLYNKLFYHFPNKISLSELYLNSSIRKLALLIEERYAHPEVHHYELGEDPLSNEIKRDATVESDQFKFQVSSHGNYENPKAILLTGVTGFVGLNILVELLQTEVEEIYLLIRSEDEEHARKRLLKAMEDQLIPASVYDDNRINLLAGDLAKPHLGLLPATYNSLAHKIDVVYHAGSSVNFIQPYSYMKSANVEALHTLIKFVTTDKLKQLSLLSTVGVFSWEHYFTKPSLIKEDTDPISAFKYLSRDMGYVQSKWVMEQVAKEAINQGVPIVIFRLGYVFCHSVTGATAKYQWWSSLIKTCVDLKCYPILVNQKEELTMVDFVSKAVTYISKNPKSIGEIFQLSPAPADNMTVMEFFELLNEEFEFDLTPVPYQDWMKLWEDDENSSLYPLLNLFKFKAYDDKSLIEIHQNTPDFDITNTNKFLENSSIENTTIKRENVEAFCKYLGIL